MNEITDNFFPVGNKFLPEMHLKQLGFTYSSCDPFTKIKKELKSLRKLEIYILFIKINLIELVFNMIWLMANQKI